MKKYQKKISSKHNDSFFYDGFIAETENYKLYAEGEIRIVGMKYDSNFICNGFKTWDEETKWENNFHKWNDDDLSKIDGVDYEWDNNNWFEIFDKAGEWDMGIVYHEYDEAIMALGVLESEAKNKTKGE